MLSMTPTLKAKGPPCWWTLTIRIVIAGQLYPAAGLQSYVCKQIQQQLFLELVLRFPSEVLLHSDGQWLTQGQWGVLCLLCSYSPEKGTFWLQQCTQIRVLALVNCCVRPSVKTESVNKVWKTTKSFFQQQHFGLFCLFVCFLPVAVCSLNRLLKSEC